MSWPVYDQRPLAFEELRSRLERTANELVLVLVLVLVLEYAR
jgi:hypothetical protein